MIGRMKLLVAGIYPPDVGGPATYAVLLEQELPKRGIEVAIAPFGDVRHLPPLIRHVAYFWKLLSGLKVADALFVQDTVSCGLPALCASWLAQKPMVLRIGGDYAWEQGTQRFGITDSIEDFQKKRYGVRVEILRLIQVFVVRHAGVVIAPSRYLGGIIEGWMRPLQTPLVVYNGIEFPLIARTLMNRPKGILIASAGRLVPWKGFDELIEVVSAHQDWTLAIMGDGPEKGRLLQIANERHCEERIILTGNLSREDMLGWIEAADVFVLNSSYEGLSHLLVEVQSLGVPAIATSIGGNKEVVTDGESGLLVPPHAPAELSQKIELLLGDPALARRLAERGRIRARDFSIDTTMDSLAGILKGL